MNGTAAARLGDRAESYIGKTLWDVFPKSYADRHAAAIRRVIENGQGTISSTTTVVQGQSRWYRTSIVPLLEPHATGKPAAMIIARDETERRRRENEVVDTSAREQQRFGQLLHDTLGQQLVGIGFLCKALEGRVGKDPATCDEVRKIRGLVDDAVAMSRKIARGLSPVALENGGLAHALERLAADTREVYGLGCTLELHGEPERIPEFMQPQLYYIASEAVNNAVKHAGAREISIALRVVDGGDGELAVHDDGRGLHAGKENEDGLGLRIMRYRAELIEATFRVGPKNGSGTVVSCAFRIRDRQAALS